MISTWHILLAAALLYFLWPRLVPAPSSAALPSLPSLPVPQPTAGTSDREALAAIRRRLASAEQLTDPVKSAFDTIAAALSEPAK
jgi:hypothetical protein